MRDNNSSSGFGTIGILLVVLVLALISFGGWYVWQKNSDEKESSDSVDTSHTEKALVAYERTTTVPDDWATYTNDTYGISFRYPAGLSISENLITKQIGEDTQDTWSRNATEIYILCIKNTVDSQWCAGTIDINNQPYADSVAQFKDENGLQNITEMIIDDNQMMLFDNQDEQVALIGANTRTYGIGVISKSSEDAGGLTEQQGRIIFDSIQIN